MFALLICRSNVRGILKEIHVLLDLSFGFKLEKAKQNLNLSALSLG